MVYTITTLPTNATLYYNGTAITSPNFIVADPTLLSVDPDDGDQTVVFNYTTTDEAGVVSQPATVTMKFSNIVISGHLFDDGNGDGNINGTAISQPSNTQLYANLIDASGNVVASTPIVADGTYSFETSDGVETNTNYTIELSTAAGIAGQPAPGASLPADWNNADGEQPGNALNGNDGTPDGVMSVSVGTANLPNNDFGINHAPTADDKSEPLQANPGGTNTVTVPTLTGSDDESSSLVYTITTLPTNATLYYNGTAITSPNFIVADPTLLSVDPDDGDQTVVFNYTTTDEAGVVSQPATVTMKFSNIVISGHLFDDGNGDGNINGTAISQPSNTQLYANLIDASGNVVASTPIVADGTYSFETSDGVETNTNYTIELSTAAGIAGQPAPGASLPADWNNADGEQPSNALNGNDGTPDGVMSVSVGTANLPNNDFGINHAPIANDTTEPSQVNPGGTVQVQVPALNVTDTEDGTPTTITIKTLPSNGTLYYNGVAVTAGQVIPNYDPAKLTVDPIDGNPTVVFDYTTTDAAGVESNVATVTMPFTGLSLSGHVYDDGNGDGNINGTAISQPSNTQLYANLIDASGNVVASKPIAADGTYIFTGADGVTANTNYTIELSTAAGIAGQPAPGASLPADWNNADGEQPSNALNGNDGIPDGVMSVSVGTANLPNNDFGINHAPIANDTTEPSQVNPGGTVQVQVPALNVTDTEDGTPTTITIKTLPSNGTLYYNGVAVTAGQVIPNYDPAKLTVDPIDGNPTVVFDYTTTDAAGVESNVATVTMPFLGLELSGNIYDDGNGDGNVNGTPISKPDGVQLYVTLIDENGVIKGTQPVNPDGTFHFDGTTGVAPHKTYKIVLSTTSNGTIPVLPEKWHNSGENINSQGTGNDGSPNGVIIVSVEESDITAIDFGINKEPEPEDKVEPKQPNRPGNYRLPVPPLAYTDHEDGAPTIVTITTLPDNATLYYNGEPVLPGQVIPNFDNALLTVDPYDGDLIVKFKYTVTDSEGVESDEATVTMPFYHTQKYHPTPTPTPLPTPNPTPTQQPSDVSDIEAESAVIHWEGDINNVFGYKIYQNGILIDIVDSDVRSYKATGLAPNTEYSYTVIAYNGHGEHLIASVQFKTADNFGWLIPVYHMMLN